MKSIAITTALLACLGLSQSVVASAEVKLKKSCVKEHPLVNGIADPTLLTLYSEICNKNNKANHSTLLALAAERFQEIGLNYHALKIISELEAQGFSNAHLTDAKFLAGANLAKSALTQMRINLRYLSRDKTYPVALDLKLNIDETQPAKIFVPNNPSKDAPKTGGGAKTPQGGKTGGGAKTPQGGKTGGGTKIPSGGKTGGGGTTPPNNRGPNFPVGTVK